MCQGHTGVLIVTLAPEKTDYPPCHAENTLKRTKLNSRVVCGVCFLHNVDRFRTHEKNRPNNER